MSLTAVLEAAWWTAIAGAVWLATLSGVTLPELCFAIGTAIPCGILACAGRRALGASWRLRPRWVWWLLPVTGSLFAELAELARVAVTGPREGRLETVDLPAEPVEDAAGREALATLALCATPGSMVADCDPARHRLTLHVLVSAGPRVEEAISR